ncbi:uncharacterized protein MYCGRDRAFT_90345 [Zymoseptoria tritici IPO323]|uniref:Uncharacterized protein n=1 Tax=Zymoseptoria tritici (strain CBS 115943 / IPO323) TaxID=336722 RepID=F9X1Z5_ZYMTI|nr:uncharacterized protein MYCGRDRAFT_90345 [Zymoseptoria tritici IPO323]EGP90787.1 hypothetical protein MYCGRDRAFT_90345 [Zymoseptoria tritici IPO323]
MPPFLSLPSLATRCETAASGLEVFRPHIPSRLIASLLSDLYALSSVLQRISTLANSHTYGPSFWRVETDLDQGRRALQATLDDVHDMFRRSGSVEVRVCWEDAEREWEVVEGWGLGERLGGLRMWFESLVAIVEGREGSPVERLRGSVNRLVVMQRWSGEALPNAGPPAHPPRLVHPHILSETNTSVSSSSYSQPAHRAPSPSPPILYPPSHSPPPPHHWTTPLLTTPFPQTPYHPTHQSASPSQLYAAHNPSAISHLRRHAFHPTLTFSFDQHSLTATLHHRHHDHHAQILVETPHLTHQPSTSAHESLTNLKLIRRGSLLHFCHFDPWVDERGREGEARYEVWATLNFHSHERMVLFYSAFVAMKAQSRLNGTPESVGTSLSDELRDGRALESARRGFHGSATANVRMEAAEEGEEVLFDATFVRAPMDRNRTETFQCLRLLRDLPSGVMRLEATPLRGPRRDVPLWTKFIDPVDGGNWIERLRRRVGLGCGRRDDGGVVGFVDVESGVLPDEWTERTTRGGIELEFEDEQDAADLARYYSFYCMPNSTRPAPELWHWQRQRMR